MNTVTEIRVNGTRHSVEAGPERSLLSVLREDLDLTGSKYGCGEGQCGACTVLVDGRPARSCLTRVGDIEGKEIMTIEGLAKNGRLHPLQEAFIEVGVMQCGYCVPGLIMSGVGLLNTKPSPTEAEIKRGMQGNICRCCTYPRIVAAIRLAARAMKGGVE